MGLFLLLLLHWFQVPSLSDSSPRSLQEICLETWPVKRPCFPPFSEKRAEVTASALRFPAWTSRVTCPNS